jgi:hypothetical protein
MRRQSQERRARRALVWGLLGFVALQLGAVVVMERWWPELRDPQFAYKEGHLNLRLREAGPGARPKLVCVLGTSRTTTALRGGLVEADLERRLGGPVIVYNFGIPADPPLNQLLNLERLLADGIRPDLVVLEAFPYYLRDKCTEMLATMPADRLGLRDRALLSGGPVPVPMLTRWKWECLLASWYVHRLEVLSVLVPQILYGSLRQDLFRGCDGSGFILQCWVTDPATRPRALESARAWYGPPLGDFRLGGPFCVALRRALERCRQEGIPAALLIMPEGPAFQALYAADAWPQVEAFLHESARIHGAAVINARGWCAEDDFLDSHHLLFHGADKFTRRLAEEALVPLLRGAPLPAGRLPTSATTR